MPEEQQIQQQPVEPTPVPTDSERYFSSSSFGGDEVVQPEWEEAQVIPETLGTDQAQQEKVEEAKAPVSPEMQELADKLGIDPNEELGAPPEPKEEVTEEPKLNPDDWYAKQFEQAEAKQFAENFKKYIGIDIKEVYGLINNTAQVTQGLEHWRKQVSAEQQMGQLQQELGEDFHEVMPQVLEEFNRIKQVNPTQAQALDNLDGARYIAAYIRQKGVQPQRQRQQAPQYDFPNVRRMNHGSKPPAPTIKMSEFITWDDAEVQARMSDIVLARQHGTFIHDI